MRQGAFKLSMQLGRKPTDHPERVKVCREMGVTGCVTGPDLLDIGHDQYESAMRTQKEAWEEAGFTIPVYETMTPVAGDHIRRGTPGREEKLKNFIAAVEAMGRVGIPVLCYNLGAGGSRTDWVPMRGGAISSRFDYAKSNTGRILSRRRRRRRSSGTIWPGSSSASSPWPRRPGCAWATIPTIHPSRPIAARPRSWSASRPTGACSTSPRARTTASPSARETSRPWARTSTRRRGNSPSRARSASSTTATWRARQARASPKTFHDDGPTDMARMLEIYARAGFEGPIRPDHAPNMGFEDADATHGYSMLGKIFAFGCIIGMMQPQNLACD